MVVTLWLAVYALPMCMLTSLSVDEILLPEVSEQKEQV